jgi:cyclohexa-1,5-dienecarbonyl-CoA hydratase
MSTTVARLEYLHEGRVARIVLAAPKANILDRAMIATLEQYVRSLQSRGGLCAVAFAADGPHFSFGASVEEHLPEQIAGTLDALHSLLRAIVDLPAPTIAAIRGQCLGGGFELALACDLLIAEQSAKLGCPEIRLGVFPPAASALLPARIGSSRGAAMVLTGDSMTGSGAAAAGLVARVAPDGALDAALETWLADTFLPRSPAALRFAAQAVRRTARRALEEDLGALERLYLDQLMEQPDAVEGIRAFLEKRQPRWSSHAHEPPARRRVGSDLDFRNGAAKPSENRDLTPAQPPVREVSR